MRPPAGRKRRWWRGRRSVWVMKPRRPTHVDHGQAQDEGGRDDRKDGQPGPGGAASAGCSATEEGERQKPRPVETTPTTTAKNRLLRSAPRPRPIMVDRPHADPEPQAHPRQGAGRRVHPHARAAAMRPVPMPTRAPTGWGRQSALGGEKQEDGRSKVSAAGRRRSDAPGSQCWPGA